MFKMVFYLNSGKPIVGAVEECHRAVDFAQSIVWWFWGSVNLKVLEKTIVELSELP